MASKMALVRCLGQEISFSALKIAFSVLMISFCVLIIAFSVLILLSPSFQKVHISAVPAGLTIITP